MKAITDTFGTLFLATIITLIASYFMDIKEHIFDAIQISMLTTIYYRVSAMSDKP